MWVNLSCPAYKIRLYALLTERIGCIINKFPLTVVHISFNSNISAFVPDSEP